ncbi:uncharacterized protein LOC117574821 isoform X2 [Drosophila albomicans]|uniref:Uncharacterized protein LOC117574821 isoform X2 n=1 Tax=Drosophila albomicans TaxID=7291 RepID=A0A9C6WLF5_DROAB|nr:uncharacterized protein LOC117574821 isoform X2 [Drosophila albomicans]
MHTQLRKVFPFTNGEENNKFMYSQIQLRRRSNALASGKVVSRLPFVRLWPKGTAYRRVLTIPHVSNVNNTQVELNRAILKNVGKRVFLEPTTWVTRRYQQQQQQQQLEEERQREQLRREQLLQQHFPSQLWNIGWPQSNGPASSSSASSRFFDFLQRPEAQVKQQQPAAAAPQQLLDDVNKSLNAGALGLGNGKGNGEEGVAKHQQPDGNEIANETNHENGSRKALPLGKSATGDVDNGDAEDVEQEQDDMLDELKFNWVSEQPEDLDIPIEASNANARLPWRLIYRMHKNPHYAN